MNKKYFLIILVLLIALAVNGQETLQTVTDSGASTSAGREIQIRSTDYNRYLFLGGALGYARIGAYNIQSGYDDVIFDCRNVGIGTATPIEKLDVNGGIRATYLIFPANGTSNKFIVGSDNTSNFYIYDDTPNIGGYRLSIKNNGTVGIGTSNPSTGLQLGSIGPEISSKQIYIPGVYNFEGLKIGQIGNGNAALEIVNHNGSLSSYGVRIMANIDDGGPGLQFQYASTQNSYGTLSYQTGMFMGLGGNVGIGTTTPTVKLSVNGKIRAHEIKVDTNNWPDYVFEDDYKKASLKDLESYIKINKHLPEMPSAKEVVVNGVELGEMNKLLLKKVEELTLHLIEQNKNVEQLLKEVRELKSGG